MLQSLSIRHIVLIDRFELSFGRGLGVLTGETGAGKSILLDALGLALGERAQTHLIRAGEEQASVTACFQLPLDHLVFQLLDDQEIPHEEDLLILRRTLSADGRSKAFINDHPVSTSLLKQVGSLLVEIHGQFDHILDPSTHRDALDRFGGHETLLEETAKAYETWGDALKKLREMQQALETREQKLDFLTHALQELETLNPKAGEEEGLLQFRSIAQNKSRIIENVQIAFLSLSSEKGTESSLAQAHKALSKAAEYHTSLLEDFTATLDRLMIEAHEVSLSLQNFLHTQQNDSSSLEEIENRLYDLRACARKHGVTTDALPDLLKRFKVEKEALEGGLSRLEGQEKEVEITRALYLQVAQRLSDARKRLSVILVQAVERELPPLKLEKAKIKASIEPLAESHWSSKGFDQIEFLIQTNPGTPFGGLSKIASGGERSRLMLALKVIMARENLSSLLVFDEIDTGVGGAVASAIGERLARLAQDLQVLSITHAPQVAAYADFHLKVEKETKEGKTLTYVQTLSESGRQEEIARMLAGEKITPEARAAALTLLEAKKAA